MAKKSKKEEILPLRKKVLHSLDKTLRNVYYLSTLSSVLLKLHNSRKNEKSNYNVNKYGKRDISFSTEKFVSEWRDYLLWIHQVLEQVNTIVGKPDSSLATSSSQLHTLLSLTRNLRFALKNSESVLAFLVLSKFFYKTFFGSFKLFRMSNVIGLATISLLIPKFESVIPTLEDYSKSLSTVVGDSVEYFKGPLFQYWAQFMDELQESNPSLYKSIQIKIQQFEPVVQVPKTIINYTKSITKQIDPIISPIAEDLLEIAYKGFRSSYNKIKKYSKADPMQVLNEIRNESWTKDYTRAMSGIYSKLASTPSSSQNLSKL